MTEAFAKLQTEPQTGITRSDVAMDERSLVRKLSVAGGAGSSSSGDYIGSFTPVYYLEGDESAAARKFVDVNEDPLERVDFSKKNVVSTSLPQDVYDLVLHHVGERVRTVYSTVVVEERRDGTTWVMDREYYESQPESRYSIGSELAAKAPPGVDLREVFEDAGSPIRAGELEAAGVRGGLKQVLDYYRVAGGFACRPATVDGEIAVVKE